MKRRSLLIAPLGLIAPFGLAPLQATAEKFPSRTVKVVVPWPAGGFVDAVTRAVTTRLSSDWGTPIIVENKPGAEGSIGSTFVAQSAPDGYTWLIGTLTTTTAPSLTHVSWNPVSDFSGVAMLAASALIAVVPASLPASSLKDFVALAKREPGKLNYLNSAIGSATHLNTELLKRKEHIDLVSVLYAGQPPGVPDLVSGRLQFALLQIQVAAPLIKAGKVKPLAVSFPKRISDFPSVPTFAEAGFPEANVIASDYIVVPKHTPRNVVATIAAAVQKTLLDPDVRRRIETAGAVVSAPTTPEQVDAFLKADTARWGQFFKENKVNVR